MIWNIRNIIGWVNWCNHTYWKHASPVHAYIYLWLLTEKKAQLCNSFTFHSCAWILHLLLSWKDINELVKSLSSMNWRQWLQITIFVFWRVSTSNCGPEMDRFVETPPPPSSHYTVVFIPQGVQMNFTAPLVLYV